VDHPFAPQDTGVGEPHPRQVAFEDGRVRLVLDQFDLIAHIPELVRRFEEKWGRRWLTFESFFEHFPGFPVLLEAHSFYRVARHARPAALFRSFGETFFLRRYLDVYGRGREEAEGRPIGMVFPFDGYRDGMVIHNGRFATGGTRMIHDLARDVAPHRVTIEPFLPFLRYLARQGWTAETPLPAVLPVQRPLVRRGYLVRPWMNRALGCGPARDVLAFLRTVLHSRSAYDAQFLRSEGGERFVVIDHAGLARQTGLSPEQVKRGLKKLCEDGLITTRRRLDKGQMKSQISLLGREALPEAGA
jgi:hypothetical protein